MIENNTENINLIDEANVENNNAVSEKINVIEYTENNINPTFKTKEEKNLESVEIENLNEFAELPIDEEIVIHNANIDVIPNEIIENEINVEGYNDRKENEISEDGKNNDLEIVGINELSDRELLNQLSYLIKETNVEENKKEIEKFFEQYRTNQKEKEKQANKELQEKAGESAKLDKFIDPCNDELLELEKEYKQKKVEIFKEQEKIKQNNLEAKLEIIDKIKAIINVEGATVDKSFVEFKNLQNQWTEIGPVPSSDADALWKNYQLQVGQFYKLLKLNYELKELDQKKNLAQKIELCEKAEELLLEQDLAVANNKFQELFTKWKEIGHVTPDKRQEIWDRFRETGNKIRNNATEHFDALREERNANYNRKLTICEDLENIINNASLNSNKEWAEMTEKVISLQKTFNEIGVVPKANKTEVFERFRSICNKFFDAKKEYYASINSEHNENLQKKIDLCVNAESLKDSTEWKKTSELFLNLQRKWKEIGPVPYKESDAIWKRFRAACDVFFNAKSEYYSNIGVEQENNKIKKEELIKEINSFTPSDNQNDNIESLKAFQARWTSIGHVARSVQENLYSQYKSAIDALYKNLKLNNKSIDISNFKEQINDIATNDKNPNFNTERKKILDHIRTIEIEINKIENTKSYFNSGSKDIIADFDKKIQKCLDDIAILKEKKKILDLKEKEFLKKEKEQENE